MKTPLLFITLLTCYFNTITIFAQSHNWLWAKSVGGSSGEIGNCIISDASGYIYVAGEFYDSFIIMGNDTLTNTGTGGIFIAKYDSLGNVLWAAGANGNGNVLSSGGQTNCIALDGNGNLVIAGEFNSDTFTFGNTVFFNHATNGTSDIFIATYDTSGNLLSASSNGGNDNDRVEGIASDGKGNIYMTGSFESPSVTFGTTTLPNNYIDYFDMFIVKYNNSGNVVWAKKAGGSDHDDGAGICTDTSGNVYVAGWFRSPTIILGSTTLTNPSGWNYGYVVKYDSLGNIAWAKRSGDAVLAITSDPAGYIYVTGQFTGTLAYDTIVLSSTLVSEEMFVAKYDLSGNVVWAKNSIGTAGGYDSGFNIKTDVNGNVFVTGIFNSDSIVFDSVVLTNYNHIGAYDIFVVQYDNSGNNLWTESIGGDAWDLGYGLADDAQGNIYMTGYFQSATVAFDSTTLTNTGSFDMFIAKLGNTILTSSPASDKTVLDEVLVYPNPFSGSATISFTLPHSQKISMSILDVNGRLISSIADKIFDAGENKLTWSVHGMSAGVYFLQFQSVEDLLMKKLIVTN